MKPTTIESIHPRMAASFALIPITIGIELGLYISISMGLGMWLGEIGMVILLVATPTVLIYIGSLLIWCPVVHWTARKVKGTAYVSLGWLASVGTSAGLATLLLPMYFMWPIALVTAFVSVGIALVLLAWIWWTPPHERPAATAVPCPKCGYDMRGQHDCTCPECGNSFTLAEITAQDQTA